ncbi:CxxC motif protein [Haloarcula virus Hardyhisp2]|uniref:CxxC motif protein n=1 Tax=Haloarcula virus Hardyhisp2 TaxID=2811386 RepID=A0A898KCW3_9VIRU|nr:CxxC motif protein [Haloarcula virus Hardyhisp2]QSJ05053.1 CxxC motif protein [Haloarcula virus Hardyhisp2]
MMGALLHATETAASGNASIAELLMGMWFVATWVAFGLTAFQDFIEYDVDYSELEQCVDECPKCDNQLYVKYGKYVNTYRCMECHFEGIREPIVYAIMQASKERYESLKNRLLH